MYIALAAMLSVASCDTDVTPSVEDKRETLVVCGDNMIYMIDAEKAVDEGFDAAVTWSWDASSAADIVGGSMIRLDDCKVVDGGTKILATSSYSWAVLLDIATKQVLWWSKSSKNAHSADLLPGGRIAVACANASNGLGNRVQIFDIGSPNEVKSYVELGSAHGVVWNDARQRLYAVGGSTLAVYELTDWDTDTPTLTLENTYDTSGYVTGLHDLTYVNETTLLLAGRKAAFLNLSTGKFVSLPHFNGSTGLKSVNYDNSKGDCWYTDATDPKHQVDYDWATDTIFHTSDVTGNVVDRTISVPEGFNMYKVRVMNW